MLVTSPGGSKYFGTFIDESTKYSYVYFLKSKDEIIKYFKEFKNEFGNQTYKIIYQHPHFHGRSLCLYLLYSQWA
jgi:hypothetical protein